MGFRNPPTSASAVDTGDTAGVKLFGNAENPGAGVVRWYVGGDTADATLASSQTGSGPSSWSVSYPASAGSVSLNRRELQAGGYDGAVTLTGPDEVVLAAGWTTLQTPNGAAAYARVRSAPAPVVIAPAAGWTQWNDGIYKPLRFTLLSSGIVHVTGVVTFTGGTSLFIAGVGGSFAPKWSEILGGSVNDVPRTFTMQSNGLYLRGALPAAGQFVSLNGSYLAAERDPVYR